MGSIAAATYVAWPRNDICTWRQWGCHVSISLMYSPLLIKTLRIFRIFSASRFSVRMPSFVSGPSQMMLVTVLVFIQVYTLRDRSSDI